MDGGGGICSSTLKGKHAAWLTVQAVILSHLWMLVLAAYWTI